MKRICLLLTLLIYTFSNVHGQIRFSKFYDFNKTSNLIVDVIPLEDSGYFTVSQCTDFKSFDTLNYQKTHLYLIKTDKFGDTIFTNVITKPRFSIKGLKLIKSNWGYLLAGEEYDLKKYNEIGLGAYVKLWRITTNGDTISTNNYDIQLGDDQVVKIIKTHDNGFAVLGQTCNQIQSGKKCNYFLMKLDSVGNKQWHQIYKQSSISFENPNSVIQLADGTFYLFGQSSISGIMKWFLVKTDSAGNLLWKKTYNEYPRQAGVSLAYNNGKIILVGSYNSMVDGSGISKGCIVFVDTSGTKILSKSYAESNRSEFTSVIYSNNKCYLAGVNSHFDPLNRTQGWLLMLDNDGDITSQKLYNPNITWSEQIYNITKTSDGFLMSGYGVDPNDTVVNQDAWLLKVDSFGCLTPGCQLVGIDNIPFSREEIKIYPNPSKDKIQFKHSGKIISYRIADYTGKLLMAGNYLANGINVEHLPSGTYVVQVLLEGKVQAFGKLLRE